MPANPQDTTYSSDADLLEERGSMWEDRAEKAERDLAAAVLREREECALIAQNFGPSRPPVDRTQPRYRDRHLGECAASSSIAILIRARSK